VSEYTDVPSAGTGHDPYGAAGSYGVSDAGYGIPAPRGYDGPPAPEADTHHFEPTFVPEDDQGPATGLPTHAPLPTHASLGSTPTAPMPTAQPAAETASRLGVDDNAGHGIQLADMLETLIACGGSDLHLTAGAPPTVRLNGVMRPIEGTDRLTPPDLQRMIYQVISQKQRERFEEVLELDFAYTVPGRARFRVNVFRQRDSLGAVFRVIPSEIKALEDLGLPPQVGNFAGLTRGFVLVTGPTGSGKSTTLASIIDLANRTRHDHIMTVEDPIEFLHRHQNCVVNQREVGEDTLSFANALKHALRQDPDIILVGELRDLETISVALTAAETGHLVFGTLHTQDAAQTVDRVIDVFPPHQQQQIRVMLAGALQGVVCQTLVKTADGRGRVAATEVMIATPAVRNLIREGKTHQIYTAMQAGAEHGMVTMDQSLATLVRRGAVSYEQALEKCHHAEDFNRLCGRI
jgi:twitching motility protein PilT